MSTTLTQEKIGNLFAHAMHKAKSAHGRALANEKAAHPDAYRQAEQDSMTRIGNGKDGAVIASRLVMSGVKLHKDTVKAQSEYSALCKAVALLGLTVSEVTATLVSTPADKHEGAAPAGGRANGSGAKPAKVALPA